MTDSKYWVSRNIVTVHEWAVGHINKKNSTRKGKIHVV